MPRSRLLPKRSLVQPVFEAYALRASDPRAAASATRRLPGRWRLRAVSEEAGEFEVIPVGARRPSAAMAWEQSRRLAGEAGIKEAEPLFFGPGLQPDPGRWTELLAPHERRGRITRSGGGREKPLPCAQKDFRWSVRAVGADAAWGTSTGASVTIGHPDTGYTRHPEIWTRTANRVLASSGYDFVADKADPLDPLRGEFPGHGAATASVIMSGRGGGAGAHVDGIAPEARLVPLRVSDSVIHFSFANVRRAVLRVVDRVQVISMSLGGPFPSRALRRALAQAAQRGVVTVAAAGNQYPFVVYPARYPEVLAVAASNCASGTWKDTTRGAAVDCSAPGESVWRAQSRLVTGAASFDVAPGSGSSYAAAVVAGVCALWVDHHGHGALFERYGAKLAAVFRKIVVESGCETPSGWDQDKSGAGIIHAGKVLAARLPASSAIRAPRAPTMMESAVDYFPTLEPDEALAAITAGVTRGKRGGVRGAFEVAGDELLFLLGSNAELRALIYERAKRRRGRGARTTTGRALSLDASDTFRETWGL